MRLRGFLLCLLPLLCACLLTHFGHASAVVFVYHSPLGSKDRSVRLTVAGERYVLAERVGPRLIRLVITLQHATAADGCRGGRPQLNAPGFRFCVKLELDVNTNHSFETSVFADLRRTTIGA